MKNLILALSPLVILSLISFSCTPKLHEMDSFEGQLVYRIQSNRIQLGDPDSLDYQIIYAKDSLLRIENFTPLGKQVYIKHLNKNKAYILMEFGDNKYAIQTIPDEHPNAEGYFYQPTKKKKLIAGFQAEEMQVFVPDADSSMLMYFYTAIPKKYTEALPNAPGLPVKYTIYSNDEFFWYELESIRFEQFHIDLFGIPSDFEKITMEKFVELFNQQND